MDSLWNQEVTKQLIFDIYGKDQMLLARDSLVSMVERADFASFHIHEVTLRWDQHIGEVRDLKMGEVLAPTCDDRKTRYASRFHEIGAHVQACVQSLHSLPDILSHALYYGLALDKKFKLNEKDISHKAVAKKLALDQSLEALHKIFNLMVTEGEFNYLTALDNHGKHRSIVKSAVWFHLNPDPKRVSLEFLGFNYAGTRYDGRPILPFLIGEYDRMDKRMVECGIELNNILQLRR